MTRYAMMACFLVVATSAMAADIPVTATKLVVVDKLAAATKAKVVFVVKDAAVTKGAALDADSISARLDVRYDNGSAAGAFIVPAGASVSGSPGWLVNKESVAKYANKSAPDGPDAKVTVIKPGKVLKLVGKGLGDTPLDILAAGDPGGSVFTAFCVDNAGEENCHCSEFTGCVYKSIAHDTGAKLVCKMGLGDAACSAVVPPTTSSSTTTSSTTTSSTTTTLASPTVLEFTSGTGAPGSVCGTSRDDTDGPISFLTCGGLDVGGSAGTWPEVPIPDGSTSSFTLSCTGSSCTVGGTATTPAVDTAAPDCTTTGCTFGAPQPIPNPSVPTLSTCVVSHLTSAAVGQLNLGTGAAALDIPLAWDVYLTGTDLCPTCSASGTPTTPGSGTCLAGARAGLACTSTNSAGLTRDCLPSAGTHVANIPVNFSSQIVTAATVWAAPTGLFCPGQGSPGGCLGSTACRSISETGTPAGTLTVGVPSSVTLVATVCIPSTGHGSLDAAGDLPGPGALSLPGTFTVY